MVSYANAITKLLELVGCDKAFGVSGGYVFTFWKSLDKSEIDVYHFRHESGAGFAALEYALHTDKVAITFATSGPGIYNSLTSLKSARADGARLVFLSAITTENQQYERKIQETTQSQIEALTGENINQPFGQAIFVKSHEDLENLEHCLQSLAQNPLGGTLGVFLTPTTQNSTIDWPAATYSNHVAGQICPMTEAKERELSQQVVELQCRLSSERFFLWVGFGARHAATLVHEVAERFKTPVICTPRAKGIFPETHPLYLGSSGLGTTIGSLEIEGNYSGGIVLGSRLAEFSSFHMQMNWTKTKLFCINLEKEEVHRNTPQTSTIIQAEVGDFLQRIVDGRLSETVRQIETPCIPFVKAGQPNQVHPVTVMAAVQDIAINRHHCVIISDAGNSLCWTAHYLKFCQPNQYRTCLSVSAMGHGSCGAVGIALAGAPVVAIVGDGAMLMHSEVNTAVQYQQTIVWIVMNDQAYNMCYQVPRIWGDTAPPCAIPEVDFAQYARALGCEGFSATSGEQLTCLLDQAIQRKGPTVIDVKLDADAKAPSEGRASSLTGNNR